GDATAGPPALASGAHLVVSAAGSAPTLARPPSPPQRGTKALCGESAPSRCLERRCPPTRARSSDARTLREAPRPRLGRRARLRVGPRPGGGVGQGEGARRVRRVRRLLQHAEPVLRGARR